MRLLFFKSQVAPYVRHDGITVGGYYRRAAQFAARKHAGQFRKDGKTPYIAHPASVAAILRAHGVQDEATITAALCHDTLEDTDTSYDELRESFGQVVADTVKELTNDANLPKPEQKRAQIAHGVTGSARWAAVKLADKIANLTDIIRIPPAGWDADRKIAYYNHAKAVVDNMTNAPPALKEAFNKVYQAGLKEITRQ